MYKFILLFIFNTNIILKTRINLLYFVNKKNIKNIIINEPIILKTRINLLKQSV